MELKPNSVTTAIGSFPHLDAQEACDLIFESTPAIPVWPQLPKKSFFEDMNNQYSKSLPCYFIDEENNKYGFNSSNDFVQELEKFYSKIIEEDIDYFGFDEKYSAGFDYFLRAVKNRDSGNMLSIKGQVIGPLTHGIVADTSDGKYAIYKPDLFDAIVKNCTMNARWQIRKMKEIFPSVIMFIDEPSLSIIGSGYYSVDHDLIINSFDEIIAGIRDEGGIPAMHCCGNADWNELLDLGIDIINFDATDPVIVDKFLNAGNINEYLENGKIIAWGIVPTISDKIESATIKDVEKNLYSMIVELVKKGIREEDIFAQSIISPSCGTGTLSVTLSEKAMRLTKELSDIVRGRM